MTRENILTKMEQSNILTKAVYTQDAYINELLGFQKMMADMIMDEPTEYVRYENIIEALETKGQKKGVQNSPEFQKGIDALKLMNKETAITISGRNSESRIHKTLTYLERKNALFQNVYIDDDLNPTEIDEIVLTESGLVILEVKSIKSDLTISEDGRLLYNNTEIHHDYSMCEKMENKRKLLKSLLETKLQQRGIRIPVKVNSYIVFVTPSKTRVNVTDLCKKERYCFSSNVGRFIESYGLNTIYDDRDMEILKDILTEQESMKKTFSVNIPMDEIRKDIASALELLNTEKAKSIQRSKKERVSLQKNKYNPVILNVIAAVFSLLYMIAPIDATFGPIDEAAVIMMAAMVVVANQVIASAVNTPKEQYRAKAA